MKTNMYKEGGIAEELMQNRFHPRNINKFTNWGFPGFDNNDVDAEKERQAKLLHH